MVAYGKALKEVVAKREIVVPYVSRTRLPCNGRDEKPDVAVAVSAGRDRKICDGLPNSAVVVGRSEVSHETC